MSLEETGRKRTKLEGLYGAAKTWRFHPDTTRSVEGGLTEARMLRSHVYSSSNAHRTKQETGPKPLCVSVVWNFKGFQTYLFISLVLSILINRTIIFTIIFRYRTQQKRSTLLSENVIEKLQFPPPGWLEYIYDVCMTMLLISPAHLRGYDRQD